MDSLISHSGHQQDLLQRRDPSNSSFLIPNATCATLGIFSLTIDNLPLAFVICVTETENAGRVALQVKLQLVRIPPKLQMDVDLFKDEVCKYHQLP